MTRNDVKAVEADLDMLAQLLEEGEGLPSRQQNERSTRRALEQEEEDFFRQTESEIARESEAHRRQNESIRFSEVKKPSRNSVRASEAQAPPRVSEVKKPSRNSRRQTVVEDEYDNDGDSRLSSVKMMEEADKPDWQKQREAEERGSFRSNVKGKQRELDRQQGINEDAGGYYSDSDDLSDDEPKFKMTYSSKPVVTQQTKRK